MDGKPFLGGANHYADDPTTKQPLLKLAMGYIYAKFAYLGERSFRKWEIAGGSVMLVMIELRGNGMRMIRLEL
jgi:hypothetical protein